MPLFGDLRAIASAFNAWKTSDGKAPDRLTDSEGHDIIFKEPTCRETAVIYSISSKTARKIMFFLWTQSKPWDLEINSKQQNTKTIQKHVYQTNLLNSAIFQRCSFTHDGLHLGAQHDARRISGIEMMESSLPLNMKIIWSWVDIKGTHPFFGELLGPFWGDFLILSSVYTENIHSYVFWNYSLNLVKNCECFVRNQRVQFVTPFLTHWHIISRSCIESAIGDVHLTCGELIAIQKTHYCTIAWRDHLSFHKELAAHQADTTNWLSQYVAMTLTMGKICKKYVDKLSEVKCLQHCNLAPEILLSNQVAHHVTPARCLSLPCQNPVARSNHWCTWVWRPHHGLNRR